MDIDALSRFLLWTEAAFRRNYVLFGRLSRFADLYDDARFTSDGVLPPALQASRLCFRP